MLSAILVLLLLLSGQAWIGISYAAKSWVMRLGGWLIVAAAIVMGVGL